MTCSRIKRVYQAPRARRVKDAIAYQRRRFEPAQSSKIERPGEPQAAYALLVDLFERTEPLFGVCVAIGDPIGGVRVCCLKRRVIDDCYASSGTADDCQNTK